MGKVLKDLTGAVLLHIFIVALLGLIGVFVWNFGVVGLLHNMTSVSYLTSSAIMLGIYIINLFVKIQIGRVVTMRQQKYMIDKIVQFYKENNQVQK